MKKPAKPPVITKFLVTTGSFVAGAIIVDDRVTTVDHWLHQLRGLTEAEFRAACAKNGWACAPARD